MTAGFQADSGLDRHATHLNLVADDLLDLADAARGATGSADAYGRFCRHFPVLLRAVEQAAVTALDQAAIATDRLAEGVRATVAAYDRAEQDSAGRSRALGK